MSPDELIAYTTYVRAGQSDILISSRPTISGPFQRGTPLSALNSPYDDAWATVTGDGLTLYMDSTRGYEYQLFFATRPFVAAEFSTPKELEPLNVFGEGGPYVTPDGSALYFHSWRGSDNPDLYRATKNGSGFNAPERLAGIATNAQEYNPVVAPDELTIYYLTQAEPLGMNGIWMATRTSMSESFANATYLPALNGSEDAIPTWISPDGCRLYFNQRDASGENWPHVAERNP